MRIISGTARGKQLAEFSGKEIRPTPDRVREALFSILNSRFGNFASLKVLELFAGSGAQSLEALSRGAQLAILVDSSIIAADVISENIRRCHFETKAKLIRRDVYQSLPGLVSEAPFDLILLDPPYQTNHIPQVIEKIESLNLLAKNGIICAEAEKSENFDGFTKLSLIEQRTYGSTQILLYGYPED